MKNIIFLLFLITNFIFAIDSNTTHEKTYIDELHEKISTSVVDLSEVVDDVLVGTIEDTSSLISDTKKLEPKSVDALFQNEKYIDETKKSFVRLSFEPRRQSIGENDFKIKLRASLALSKSKKRFKIFMGGIDQDNIHNIFSENKETDNTPEIGLSLEDSLGSKTDIKYSVGIRGYSPFIKARMLYKTGTDIWKIEPSQTIEYSTEDNYREYTKLYLDTEVIRKVLFRIDLERGTRHTREGMDYSGGVSLFWTPEAKTGLQLSQYAYGSTKYEYTTDETTGATDTYSGINNYVTQLTFRQNIYRKWFFYQVSPAISFSKANDFEANYILSAKVDLFFGKM